MALALARKLDADVVMASDPDADRLGVACKDDKGELILLNGNQTAMIFLYYIITQSSALNSSALGMIWVLRSSAYFSFTSMSSSLITLRHRLSSVSIWL